MKAEVSGKSPIKDLAFSRFKRNFPYSWPLSLSFGLVAIPSLVLGAFFPSTLVFLIPFLILPMFLSLTISLCDGHKDGDISSRKSFGYFFSYFRPPFYGSYRFIFNTLISFVLSSLIKLLLYLSIRPLFCSIYSSFDADLSGLLQLIFQYSDIEGAYKVIASNDTLSLFFELISLSGAICFALVFLYQILHYALNPFLRAHLSAASQRVLNEIYIGGLKKARPQFSRDTRSSLASLFTFFLLLFLSGVAICWFFLRPYLTPAGMVSLALGFATLIFLPLLPYYVYVLDFLFRKYSFAFVSYSLGMMEESYRKFASEWSDEEKKEIDEQLLESKKKLDELLEQSEKLEDNDDFDSLYSDEDDDVDD